MGWTVKVTRQSICDKYTDALRSTVLNNAGLVGAVLDGVFAKLLAPDSLVIEYFNGVIPSGSIDYTKGGADAAALATQLLSFFGDALGCTDGSIAPYTSTRSLKDIHNAMPIGVTEFAYFNQQVLDVLTGFGVESADVMAVDDLLNGVDLKAAICNVDAECLESICNKCKPRRYATLLRYFFFFGVQTRANKRAPLCSRTTPTWTC